MIAWQVTSFCSLIYTYLQFDFHIKRNMTQKLEIIYPPPPPKKKNKIK